MKYALDARALTTTRYFSSYAAALAYAEAMGWDRRDFDIRLSDEPVNPKFANANKNNNK